MKMKQWLAMATTDASKIIFESPAVTGIIAVVIVAYEFVYGSHELTRYGMMLLLMLTVIDWFAGFGAAKKDLIDTSSYGIEGLFRTAVLLMLPAAAHFVDLFFMTQGFASYFMIAALARHLTKSVTANIIRVGWTQWIPAAALERMLDWASDEIASKEARAQQRFDSIYKEEDKNGSN